MRSPMNSTDSPSGAAWGTQFILEFSRTDQLDLGAGNLPANARQGLEQDFVSLTAPAVRPA